MTQPISARRISFVFSLYFKISLWRQFNDLIAEVVNRPETKSHISYCVGAKGSLIILIGSLEPALNIISPLGLHVRKVQQN